MPHPNKNPFNCPKETTKKRPVWVFAELSSRWLRSGWVSTSETTFVGFWKDFFYCQKRPTLEKSHTLCIDLVICSLKDILTFSFKTGLPLLKSQRSSDGYVSQYLLYFNMYLGCALSWNTLTLKQKYLTHLTKIAPALENIWPTNLLNSLQYLPNHLP